MIEKMGIDRTGSLVDLLYGNAAPTQYVRELVQNGLDAGSTFIDLGIDPVALREGGPKRLLYRDNGHGMDAADLCGYFNRLSASSGALDAHGNYGIGAKISLLPWNHAGVEVLSWNDGPASGAGIRIIWEDGEYGLEVFDGIDDDGDHVPVTEFVADLAYCPSWVSNPEDPHYTGSGTVVICYGATGVEDTYYGPSSSASKIGTMLTRQINARYFNFGRRVTVRCWEDYSGGNWRNATGTQAFLVEHAEVEDTITLEDGTLVHWYILGERNSGRHAETGFVGALYRDERTGAVEVYNPTKAGGETFHRMRLFGVTEPKVQKRIVMLVEPPRANGVVGVRPNAARSSLDYTGSEDRSLPWATWGPEFGAQLPAKIQELLDEARSEAGPKRNMRERIRHLLDRMVHPAYRIEPTGPQLILPDIAGRPNPSGSGRAGKKTVRAISPRSPKNPVANVTTPDGSAAREFNPKLDPPDVEWRSENDEGFEEVLRDRAVSYDFQSPRSVIMNRDFFVFREEILYWRDQFPQAADSTLQQVIEEEYEAVVVTSIMHAWTRKGNFKWSPKDWERLVDPISLTATCLGFHLETKIRRTLAGKLGKAAA